MLNQPLWSILRAAHCRSTHHYFAIDALPLVQTEAGRRLVGHLLQHHRRYLLGATDPDVRFRDYQNHVVHVSEGYWGGAPRVAHQWYDRLQRYLRTDRFSDAAHAAGVLSHYFSDPFQPFHTHCSDREAILHRPFEWSILQSYDELLQTWRDDQFRVVFHLSDQPLWLGEAILHGARFAHRKLERVQEQFHVFSAVRHPAQGFDSSLRSSMAEILGLVITGWARVIERIAADAETTRDCPLPRAASGIATLSALANAPLGYWRRRRKYRRQQQMMEALCEEFRQLGRLERQLPAEIDVVHRVVRVHHQERHWQQRFRQDETPLQAGSPAAGQSQTRASRPTPATATSSMSVAANEPSPVSLPFDSRSSDRSEQPRSTDRRRAA